MGAGRVVYRALAPAAAAGALAAAHFIPKLRDAIGGRAGFRARWDALADSLASPPVWFHVASVGEFEQARPVMTALERARPDIPVVLTFSSPSGVGFARRRESVGSGSLAFLDYLPLDLAANMRFCLERARPRVIVFVKFDLWPNLVFEAADRGVPMVLIDATLSPSSRRLRFPARVLYREIYAHMDAILAISEEDAMRFSRAVPGHRHIAVVGDTRFDRVMERWHTRAETGFALPEGGPVLIAGSTWPADEQRLLPAVARLMRELPSLRFVAVPHEPVAHHVDALRRWAVDNGLAARTTSAPGAPGTRVVIVDTVGVLAEAYRLADVAYVGGAFSTGVHSVIEPAIAGLPVVFGPRHDNSFEALQLVHHGAATAVAGEGEMFATLSRYLGDERARARAGRAARQYVESQLGATEKCMAVLSRYL